MQLENGINLIKLAESFLLEYRYRTSAKTTASALWKKFWTSGIASFTSGLPEHRPCMSAASRNCHCLLSASNSCTSFCIKKCHMMKHLSYPGIWQLSDNSVHRLLHAMVYISSRMQWSLMGEPEMNCEINYFTFESYEYTRTRCCKFCHLIGAFKCLRVALFHVTRSNTWNARPSLHMVGSGHKIMYGA